MGNKIGKKVNYNKGNKEYFSNTKTRRHEDSKKRKEERVLPQGEQGKQRTKGEFFSTRRL